MAPIPQPFSPSDISTRLTSPFSTTSYSILEPRSDPPQPASTNPAYAPGRSTRPPDSFNNKGIFGLFGLLGAAMVLAAIWFFFWARHGGFVWRRNDWDDYKSTVLRRKDKNGKTLSNATPATDLGGKSVAGSWGDREPKREMSEYRDVPPPSGRSRGEGGAKRKHHHNRHHHHGHRRGDREPDVDDADVRAYRHEKPARVGGLNRAADGSHFAPSDPSLSQSQSQSAYSDGYADEVVSNNSRTRLTSSSPLKEPPLREEKKKKKKKKMGILEKTKEKRAERKRNVWERRRGGTGKDYAKDKDKSKSKSAAKSSPLAQRKKAGGKVDKAARRTPEGRVRPAQRADDDDDDDEITVADAMGGAYGGQYRPAYTGRRGGGAGPARRSERVFEEGGSEAGTSDTGTKSYAHHIPGVSRGSAGTATGTGFRRGGGGRRDSLSDSD